MTEALFVAAVLFYGASLLIAFGGILGYIPFKPPFVAATLGISGTGIGLFLLGLALALQK